MTPKTNARPKVIESRRRNMNQQYCRTAINIEEHFRSAVKFNRSIDISFFCVNIIQSWDVSGLSDVDQTFRGILHLALYDGFPKFVASLS